MEKFPLKGSRSVRTNLAEGDGNVGSGSTSTSYQSVNKKVCKTVCFLLSLPSRIQMRSNAFFVFQ